MFLFACVGVAMEVVFTALTDLPKAGNYRLLGYSYIWMIPIYAAVPVFLGLLYPRLVGWILPVRLTIYVTLILIIEYITGWILRRTTGGCPWEANYKGKRWAIHGLVRLDYVPAWAVASLIFERLHLVLAGF